MNFNRRSLLEKTLKTFAEMDSESRKRLFPFQPSLRTKVTVGVVLPLVLILGVFTVIEDGRREEATLNHLSLLASNAGSIIEKDLRHQMLDSDFEAVQEMLKTIGEHREVQSVRLLDPDGKVVFASEDTAVGTMMDNQRADCQICHQHPPGRRPESVVVTNPDSQRVFRSMQPIENSSECATCHDPEIRLLGMVLIDIPIAPYEQLLETGLRENLMWWGITILVTILVVNLVLSRFVFRRLEKFGSAIRGFGQGSIPPPISEGQKDEIGNLAGAFNAMVKQVDARNKENQALSERLRRQSTQRGELLKRLITAQEDERKRLSRELHDDLGQALGGLALRSEVLGGLIDSDQQNAREQLEEIKTLVTDTTERMYDLILDLRPSVLDDLGLVPALRSHAERALQTMGTEVSVEPDGFKSRRLTPEIETTLFRIYQEGINNIARHAEAEQAWLKMSCSQGAFIGEIRDNGRGFSLSTIEVNGNSPRGLGLLGIRERVEQCGGELEIQSKRGEGTCIQFTIPLEDHSCG